MKVRVVCRKIYDYIRYDLKEIAFPSSLPDPPNIKKRRKLTWEERILVTPFSFLLPHFQSLLVFLVKFSALSQFDTALLIDVVSRQRCNYGGA